MKKLTVLLAALVMTSISSFAAVNINVDAKKNKIELRSDKNSIVEVNLNRLDGGLYEPSFVPSNNLNISTKNLIPGVYKIEVISLQEAKTVQFLIIN
ncbi:MAG: hypothetical protein CVV25_04595 [Ignavibacteriae bacterium HGW-Ignavibacteriae-4]|jgi:hypothetical protein|nr:MAG: hypothetical protein CVV25_04595 [Ignavibacteriae bacterium HGW-Ignavibacteriae-4]